MAQVAPIRNRTMADLAPEIEPAKLLELLVAEDPTISTATPPVGSLTTGTLSADELSSVQESRSSVDKYGPIIVGLLAVNAVVGVTVLAVSVLNLMQRRALARRSTRSGHHYVSVQSHAASD